MANKQTRRSISVNRRIYDKLKAYCEAANISMSQVVEAAIEPVLSGQETPAPATEAVNA